MPSTVLAIVLVSTNPGREQSVATKLRCIPGVREAYVVYGIYDIIVEIEGEDHEAVRKVVFSKIRNLPDVKTTLTLVVTAT